MQTRSHAPHAEMRVHAHMHRHMCVFIIAHGHPDTWGVAAWLVYMCSHIDPSLFISPPPPSFFFLLPFAEIISGYAPPQMGFYQAPVNKNCPDSDMLKDSKECKEAAGKLPKHSWEGRCNNNNCDKRPNGCFHGKSIPISKRLQARLLFFLIRM